MTTTIQQTAPRADGRVAEHATRDKEVILERVLKNPRIPSPPTLALQVFQKTGQEDCTPREISELLAHDPGMCAKILKALNSAVYGRSRPVTNVRQAVTMLGNRPLRSLVLGLALPAMQSGVGADAGLCRYWRKSVAGAVIARDLATQRESNAPDDDLAACLLRDLGTILLHQAFAEQYRPIWMDGNLMASEGQCEWEERVLGVSHAEVGAALLEQWKLPMEIVEPIRFHHHPERMPPLVSALVDRAYLLNFATRLAELDDCCHAPAHTREVLDMAADRFGFDQTQLEEFLGGIRSKVEEFSAILGVDTAGCPDFDELLAVGCEELVKVSLEAPTGQDGKTAEHTETMDSVVAGSRTLRDFLDEPCSLTSGSRILQYEVTQVIGRGAMGIVLKAYDAGLNRHVAIKLLAPEMAGNEKARQRFALEARFAAALRHEHVVAIYAVNELEGVPFLVMEYVQGSSLEALIDSGRTFSTAEIANIGRQTALGLAVAHEARLIHRDVKPANILLEEGTLNVRVADFGLARAIDEDFHLSQPGLLLGTPLFMSPEQVDGKPLTAASDQFSLGSVLYLLCTGQLPFDADTMSGLLHAVADKNPAPIRTLNPSIPEGVARVVETLHAKDPTKRFSSAAEVAEKLKPWCH